MKDFDRDRTLIVSGNSNRELAEEIGNILDKEVLYPATSYSDGERRVDFGDKEQGSVRGKEVFLVQSICNSADGSLNDSLMELLIAIRALRGASASKVNVIIPYYAYARQDKKVEPRTAISARLVADILQIAGSQRVIMMDLHANQIQGFFDVNTCPVDHLYAKPAMIHYIRDELRVSNLTFLSPDSGGVDRARSYAKELGAGIALGNKKRSGANQVESIQIIGDVKNQIVIIVDDMVDTFGTMDKTINATIENGASEVHVAAIHAVLSGKAVEKIENSRVKSVTVTNTIPLSSEAKNCKKIKVVSVAKIFANAIRRIYEERSVSALFM